MKFNLKSKTFGQSLKLAQFNWESQFGTAKISNSIKLRKLSNCINRIRFYFKINFAHVIWRLFLYESNFVIFFTPHIFKINF